MAIPTPTVTPSNTNIAPPVLIDRELCMGDSLQFINGNTDYFNLLTSNLKLSATDIQNKVNVLDNRYVNISGDTMTGALTLASNPTINLHAATKQYVDGTSSLTTNGYQIMPGGLIMQWGTLVNVPLDQSFNQVTFPISFPTAALNVNATIGRSSIISGAVAPLVRNLTTTGVQIAGDHDTNTSTGNIYWLALGY